MRKHTHKPNSFVSRETLKIGISFHHAIQRFFFILRLIFFHSPWTVA